MIRIGQKIHSILYGGRDGVVYGIKGEQRPQTIGSICGVLSFGGNAEFDIVFENGTISHRLPESILHGVQWHIYSEVVSALEIQTMLDFAASETIRREAEAKKKAEAFSAAVAALRADPKYKHLQQTGPQNGVHSSKLVAINIRRELKAAFPGVKFSVRVDHHSEVITTWMDGPIPSEVRKTVDKYAGGHFDGMHDIYEHRDSPWTTVFGSSQYVTTTRKHSLAALTCAVEKVCKDFGWTPVPVRTWEDGSAWVNLGDYDKDRILGEYLAGRYQVISVAA
jgi:Large polyvalent protein associated domain 30/Large polyvalent protein associated domain 29